MNYLLYSFLAGMFTLLLTILGSLTVFSIKCNKKKLIAVILGFGGGVMIAASFFSLLLPSIEFCNNLNYMPWIVCSIGFIIGILIILIIDYILSKTETITKNNTLMVLAVIIHNIPEGLAIGVAFGAYHITKTEVSLIAAIMLSLGIGIQNFPEGAAISIPLASTGVSKTKAFLIGALSAIVEPLAALIGALLVTIIELALPIVLVIAAAIMIFVVIDEIITLSHTFHKRLTTIGFSLGFIIMMFLDLLFN